MNSCWQSSHDVWCVMHVCFAFIRQQVVIKVLQTFYFCTWFFFFACLSIILLIPIVSCFVLRVWNLTRLINHIRSHWICERPDVCFFNYYYFFFPEVSLEHVSHMFDYALWIFNREWGKLYHESRAHSDKYPFCTKCDYYNRQNFKR